MFCPFFLAFGLVAVCHGAAPRDARGYYIGSYSNSDYYDYGDDDDDYGYDNYDYDDDDDDDCNYEESD